MTLYILITILLTMINPVYPNPELDALCTVAAELYMKMTKSLLYKHST